MHTFYYSVVTRLLREQVLRIDQRILVVCGSREDRDVLHTAGFRHVTVSNINDVHDNPRIAPYQWSHQHAEALTAEDCSFDIVIVHLGLHHCRQPHKALCEMYRVAREGVLIIEPCETPLVKVGRLLRVGQEYEVHAVASTGMVSGGVNNQAIPNFVYRWTFRELLDTLRSMNPEYRIRGRAIYDLVIHWADLRSKKSKGPLLIAACAWPFLRLIGLLYPPWSNNMAVYVEKPGELHPWLSLDQSGAVQLETQWMQEHISTHA